MDAAELIAIANSCLNAPEPLAQHMAELFTAELIDNNPMAAYLAATLLCIYGNETGKQLGEATLERVTLQDAQTGRTSLREADVLLLAVKPTELRAVLMAFELQAQPPVLLGNSGICAWISEVSGVSYACAMIGTAGNVEASSTLWELSRFINFRAAVLIGMAAGLRGEVTLGDVVLAELVLAYEFQRMTTSGPSFMAKPYKPPEMDIRGAGNLTFVEPSWVASLVARVEKLDIPPFPPEEDEVMGNWSPSFKRGGILAGGKLLEDGTLPKFRRKVHDRVLAAEMEGAGFANACESLGKPWLVVRGIADYGEHDRRKHWQLPATYAAAAYVRVLLERRLVLSRIWDH